MFKEKDIVIYNTKSDFITKSIFDIKIGDKFIVIDSSVECGIDVISIKNYNISDNNHDLEIYQFLAKNFILLSDLRKIKIMKIIKDVI